jgi:hypothetical protein
MKHHQRQSRLCGIASPLSSLSIANALCIFLLIALATTSEAAGCDGKFGPLIEGTAVNKQGEVFAVNAGSQRNTIGRLTGTCGVFATGKPCLTLPADQATYSAASTATAAPLCYSRCSGHGLHATRLYCIQSLPYDHPLLCFFLNPAVTDRPNTELNSIRVLPDGRMLSSDTKNQRIVMVSQQRWWSVGVVWMVKSVGNNHASKCQQPAVPGTPLTGFEVCSWAWVHFEVGRTAGLQPEDLDLMQAEGWLTPVEPMLPLDSLSNDTLL